MMPAVDEGVVMVGADSGAGDGRPSIKAVHSVERAFTMLENLAENGGKLNLSDLASASGLPQATIHRILQTLALHGYVRREGKTYSLGPNLIFLGRIASEMLGAWSRPTLLRLADEIGETASLAVLDADDVVYLAQVPSDRYFLRMFTQVGRRLAPHATAVGKVLLAQLEPAKLAWIIKYRGLPEVTSRTITNPATLKQQLELIKLQGFAVDDGEHELGVRCVAVPVLDAPRRMAVSISGPESRLSLARTSDVVPVLERSAAELSELLNTADTPYL
jgi:IclR family acetate operon transcriptional repressor